jgi:hypothetical protein
MALREDADTLMSCLRPAAATATPGRRLAQEPGDLLSAHFDFR